MGIVICGLNGTGKSTLGKMLAKKLHFHFIDIEDLYFPQTNSDYIYASPRTREDVMERLLCEIRTHENFIFFRFVESRNENTVEEWVKSLKCPVIRIDGTKPIDENTNFIIEHIVSNRSHRFT